MNSYGKFNKYNQDRNPYNMTKLDIARHCAMKLHVFEPLELRHKLEAEYPDLSWSHQVVSNIISTLTSQLDLANTPPQVLRARNLPITRRSKTYTGGFVAQPMRKESVKRKRLPARSDASW